MLTPPGLLKSRVTVPPPPPPPPPPRAGDHLHRPALVEQCMPTNQRITLLQAPGGFGKTTLLAGCGRQLSRRGVPTAWLALEEHDEPAKLSAYLEFAFQAAGIDCTSAMGREETDDDPPLHRTDRILRAIEDYGASCVLALDELELLRNPESVALVNYLAARGPPGLHLAMACRELAPGLDVAVPVLEGRAEILTADELRFSKAEIAQYFDLKLSRRELTALASDSAGWPITLRVYRSEAGDKARTAAAGVVREVIENWVESRLLRGVERADRDFLLELSLFEQIDSNLLDEVLERTDSASRLESMTWLRGLLEPIRANRPGTQRLHPLVSGCCQKRRRREDPERFRSIHGRIALALARRGKTVSAMRHAAEAENPALVERMLADVGAARLWLKGGIDALRATGRSSTEEMVFAYPRMALVRCLILATSGRPREARNLFDDLTRAQAPALQASHGDSELHIDYYLVRGVIALYGCERLSSERSIAATADYARLADMPATDPLLCASFEYGTCMGHNLKAEFTAALDWGTRVRQRVRRRSRYLTMLVDFQLGQIAMAQGRVQDAVEHYRRGRIAERDHRLRAYGRTEIGQILIRELNLERNRIMDGEPAPAPADLCKSGTPFISCTAAVSVEVEMALQTGRVDGALAVIDEMWEYARRMELPALARYLCALNVWVLADAGRLPEAERSWRTGSLPDNAEGCLDLKGQNWREMEALACARMRLLIAGGQFDAGRNLAKRIIEVSATRGLKRTLMRALALAIVLEERANRRDMAREYLARFLGLYVDTDFARPLVREPNVAVPVLRFFLGTDPNPPIREAAVSLLSTSNRPETEAIPRLTCREEEVLQHLQTQRDREIAAALGITPDGVRYHLRNLFAKLNAHDRSAAVRRAQSFGILPPAS